MALIVGTNSYLTVQEFKDNADLLGFDYVTPAYTDLQIEQALSRSALMFVDPRYNFKGDKVDEAQAMDLPTDDVAISDIQYAATQAAWQALIGKLFVSESEQSSNGLIVSESKQLASLSKSVDYQSGTARTTLYDVSTIDSLMRPYVTSYSGGNMGRIRKC
tara:strand:- start:8948 stop:9430 length:483 start_codon:yes stop_codon:yes gene_type:complete